MNARNVCCIILTLVVFLGCRPKYKHYPITNIELVNATAINVGSYFIYRDSVTGATDSFYCDYFRSGVEAKSAPDGSGADAEYDYQSYKMTDSQYYFSFRAEQSFLTCSYFKPYKSQGDTAYDFLPLNFPFQKNNTSSSYRYAGIPKEYYPSLTIAGNTYKDVYEYTNWSYGYPFPKDTINIHTYYSLSSGLIKYSFQHPNSYISWELIRSKIIK